MSTTTHSKTLVPEKIYDMLINSKTADKVTVHFKDGRSVTGALVFNHYKGTGRLIDIEKETSIDFAIEDVRNLRFIKPSKV